MDTLGVGVQISRSVYPEVLAEDAVWHLASALGGGVPEARRAEGESHRRGARASGSRAHADRDSPKYAVSQVVGFIKGKSAIHLARVYGEHRRNFVGQHFWARGYFVSTVGRDERVIREYIKKQEEADTRLDQLGLWR
jgi:hypothetical protein